MTARLTSLFTAGRGFDYLTVPYEYMQLTGVDLVGPAPYIEARLHFVEDQGSPSQSILCPARDFHQLEPYVLALLRWQADPLEHEPPLIPIGDAGTPAAHFLPEVDGDFAAMQRKAEAIFDKLTGSG